MTLTQLRDENDAVSLSTQEKLDELNSQTEKHIAEISERFDGEKKTLMEYHVKYKPFFQLSLILNIFHIFRKYTILEVFIR